MKLAVIIVLVVIAIVSGLFYLGYYIFSQKDKYFKKYLKVGDTCIYYPNEDEDKLCEVIEINNDIVKLKDCYGDVYESYMENITSP